MTTPQQTVERTRVVKILAAELLDKLSATGITLIGPNEPAPDQDADDDLAVVHPRWCKLYWPELIPASRAARTADARIVTLTLAVGVSDDQLDADQYRLTEDIDTVVDILRGLHATHPASGHELVLHEPEGDPMEPLGEHARSRLGVITIAGLATRIIPQS